MSEIKLGWDTGTAKAEGNYMLEGREYCKHDHIPRKCDSCDYEDEIKDKDKEIRRMREAVKKAFWAGFEISHCLGGTDIQKRWNEYKDLKGLK